MSLIKTFAETSAFASGGIWEPIAANFPALKIFCKCNEATASGNIITDSIGGLTFGVTAGNITNNGDGTITPSGNITVLTGTLPDPTGKKALLIVNGKPTAAGGGVRFGTVTAGSAHYGIVALTSAGNSTVTSNGTAVSVAMPAGTVADGTFGAWACAADYGANAHAYGILAANSSVTAATPAALAGSAGVYTAAVAITSTVNPYMISLWHFTTLPSIVQIEAAIAWQLGLSTDGNLNKWVYPGFYGLS